MERHKILPSILFTMFLVLTGTPKSRCQIIVRPPPPRPGRPLCYSQFSLANYACALLPYHPTSDSSPSVPSVPSPPSRNEHEHEPEPVHEHRNGHHRHRHGHHRHRHEGRSPTHHGTPVEEECCRWLSAVDEECVCEMLVRLPVFLARPFHKYSVVVADSCNMTYTCPGRVLS